MAEMISTESTSAGYLSASAVCLSSSLEIVHVGFKRTIYAIKRQELTTRYERRRFTSYRSSEVANTMAVVQTAVHV